MNTTRNCKANLETHMTDTYKVIRKNARFTCPHCVNRDQNLIEDNGERRSSPDLTLCCVKIVPAGQDDSFDRESDGTAVCGMQWDPNSDEYDLEI